MNCAQKTEWSSKIEDKESDDKTVDLSDKGIKNKKVKSDQELTDLQILMLRKVIFQER